MGAPHEKENKDYLAKQIADEISKKVLKVNTYGYDLWYPYDIEVKEEIPYEEWPYIVCTPFAIDILGDMGSEAREVDFVQIDMDIQVAWDPGRPYDDAWFPQTIPAGSKFKLEDKKIATLYIHAKDKGHILIDVEGFTDC